MATKLTARWAKMATMIADGRDRERIAIMTGDTNTELEYRHILVEFRKMLDSAYGVEISNRIWASSGQLMVTTGGAK